MTAAFETGASTSTANIHTGAFSHARIRVAGQTGDEWDHINARLDELIRLPQGWDGYEGLPVSFQNAAFAAKMLESVFSPMIDLPLPHCVPGPSGDLQLEWHANRYEVELHILRPNHVMAWRLTPELTPDGEEVELRTDFTIVAQWLDELVDQNIAADAAAA